MSRKKCKIIEKGGLEKYVLNTLKWKNDMFVLDNQQVAILGAEL